MIEGDREYMTYDLRRGFCYCFLRSACPNARHSQEAELAIKRLDEQHTARSQHRRIIVPRYHQRLILLSILSAAARAGRVTRNDACALDG